MMGLTFFRYRRSAGAAPPRWRKGTPKRVFRSCSAQWRRSRPSTAWHSTSQTNLRLLSRSRPSSCKRLLSMSLTGLLRRLALCGVTALLLGSQSLADTRLDGLWWARSDDSHRIAYLRGVLDGYKALGTFWEWSHRDNRNEAWQRSRYFSKDLDAYVPLLSAFYRSRPYNRHTEVALVLGCFADRIDTQRCFTDLPAETITR